MQVDFEKCGLDGRGFLFSISGIYGEVF